MWAASCSSRSDGVYQFGIPAGYTIDTTLATVPSVITDVGLSGIDGMTLGSGLCRRSASNGLSGKVVALSSSKLGIYSDTNNRLIGAGCLPITNAETMYSFTAQIPIV